MLLCPSVVITRAASARSSWSDPGQRRRDSRCSRLSIMGVSKVMFNMLCSSVVVVAADAAAIEVGVTADGMGGVVMCVSSVAGGVISAD